MFLHGSKSCFRGKQEYCLLIWYGELSRSPLLYLYMYLYNAGTDSGYKCTGRRSVGLVQRLEGTTKDLYCLCAHYAVLKVVPIDYSLWKELIFPDVCLTVLDEFEGSRVVHCLSIYYIWCFQSFVLFGSFFCSLFLSNSLLMRWRAPVPQPLCKT